jgi:hypothetical protein
MQKHRRAVPVLALMLLSALPAVASREQPAVRHLAAVPTASWAAAWAEIHAFLAHLMPAHGAVTLGSSAPSGPTQLCGTMGMDPNGNCGQ